ncbi:MAG: hypothetical protein HYV96_16775 [Opitutae bacterium]|nr:hypothetical protein [Opitutae bacterium]
MKNLLLLLALLGAVSSGGAVEPLAIPGGPAPMIDQHLDDPAWQNAARRLLPDGTEIWAQQDDVYFYFAIKAPTPRIFGMEFYIAEAPGRLVDLHASAYLGERVAENGRWPDWTWWNADRWTATIVPYLMENNQRTFTALAGKEFQFSKARFSAAHYRIRFEFHYRRDQSTVYPASSAEFDPTDWLEIVLR